MYIIKEQIQKVFCSSSGAEDGDNVLFNSKLPFGTASAIQEETKNNNNRENCNVVARIASCKCLLLLIILFFMVKCIFFLPL